MAGNPLVNYIRWGFKPQGTAGSVPPPTGTDYRHDNRIIIGLSHQFIRWGYKVDGASAAISGTLAATEAQDIAAFVGNTGPVGTLAATDAQDIAAFTGNAVGGITGTLAVTDAQDIAAFTGLGGNYLSVFDTPDVAAFTGSIVNPVISNPLGKLKMYTGSLGSISNREDWICAINLVQDDGTQFDMTGATIVTYVCRQDCPETAVLTASTTNGLVTLTDAFTLQWVFDEDLMATLCAQQYDVFCRITLNDITTQILSASVAIIEGGPSS